MSRLFATPSGQWIRGHWWPESGSINSIPALDGMRALAVLLVLAFHSWNNQPGFLQPGQDPYQYPINYGRTGVHLFFVLSGFLLFMPYARWIFGLQKRPAALLFYRRRLLRVGPAYWVCLVMLALGGPYAFSALADVALHATFLSNASPQTTFTINGVFWTMAIEVQFYAILPLCAWVMHWLSRRIRPWSALGIGLGALTVLSLGETVLTKNGMVGHIPIISSLLLNQYSSLPFWLDVFSAGMGVSALYVYLTRCSAYREIPHALGNAALVAGLCVALGLAFIPNAYRLPLKDLWFGWAYAGILLGVLGGPAYVRKQLASRPLRFIGLISYSFYLWHLNVLQFLEAHVLPHNLPLNQEVALTFLVGLPCSTLVAYLSFQIAERPFIQARKRAHEIPSQETTVLMSAPHAVPITARS